MKKLAALILAIVMVACCFAACGSEGKTLDSVKEAGALTIATSPDFPPFEFLNADGTADGIEIELFEKICEKLGVELKVEQMDFDSVLPGVQAGKFDAGVAGISITEDRQKNVLFTDPYCLAAQAIVVPEGSEITCKADLEGKKIAVQTATTAESFCLANNYDVSSFAANSDAELALTTGKVDAWVIDDLTAAEMVAAYNADNETGLVILNEAMTSEPYAFAFSFGSEEIVAEINSIIDGFVADGTIASIFEKYGVPYFAPEV